MALSSVARSDQAKNVIDSVTDGVCYEKDASESGETELISWC